MIQVVMSLALAYYIIKCRPFTQMIDNYVELFNELTILVVFTLITPYVHDTSFSVERKYDHGFVVSSVIFLNVLVNFILFLKSTFKQLKVKLGPVIESLKDRMLDRTKVAKKEPIIRI